MDRLSFYNSIENSIKQILYEDFLFNNYKNQILVKKLGAEFNKTYDESYLWNRALSLSTNGCILFKINKQNGTAIKALKQAAEVYEYLSYVSEKYDKDFSFLLSALCYDIAGYQANATCMMRHSEDYFFTSTEESLGVQTDNYIIYHLKKVLLKKIPSAFFSQENKETPNEEDCKYFREAINKFYSHILEGKETRFIDSIEKVYSHFNNKRVVHIAHLLFLFLARLYKYEERSIWNNLKKLGKLENSIWIKYVKLLTNNFYDSLNITHPHNRDSVFEFWTSQIRALEKGLLSSENSFVVQMPTSTGKTFIAQLTILDELTKNSGKKAIYISPFKALTNQVETEISGIFSKLGFTVSKLTGAYEVDEFEELLLEEADLLIATPEKVDLLMRIHPEFFNNICLIIIDEGHLLGSFDERSSTLESLIIKFKIRIQNLRILFLSAVTPEANSVQISKWINNDETSYILSKDINNEDWQPTRKLIGNFSWRGNTGKIDYPNVEIEESPEIKIKSKAFISGVIEQQNIEYINSITGNINSRKYPKLDSKSETAVALSYKFAEQGNCLIFCSRPDWVNGVGKKFIELLNLYNKSEIDVPEYFKPKQNTESYYQSILWYGKDSVVTKCIERGIGIHYGDMPEPLRKAVEKDYKTLRLRVLICTNTITQGLNFPIKNLIIHSVVIDAKKDLKVDVKDFWNMIGRAGRAGIETEGQIIFLTFNDKDRELFYTYTDKENIEKIKSLYINLLLRRSSILPEKLHAIITEISEPFLLDILAEEILETDDEKIIEKIINNSLFKIQAIDWDLDLEPIKIGFRNAIAYIKNQTTPEELSLFAKTGFCLKSNKKIATSIEENLQTLKKYLENDDHLGMLSFIISLFLEDEVAEIVLEEKLKEVKNISISNLIKLLNVWIQGGDIGELVKIWTEISSKTLRDKFEAFISDGLTYKYPWGITMFLQILCTKLGIEFKDLPTKIKNISSFIKYGVNTELACFAKSLGINNRTTSLQITEQFLNDKRGYKNFAVWLSNVTIEDLSKFDLNNFDLINILETANKINISKYQQLSQVYKFRIKGTYYDAERRENSLLVKVGDQLEYTRNWSNKFDPYTIEVTHGMSLIGYVPREYSKLFAVEMDLNYKIYTIVVTAVTANENFNDIEVEMYEQ